jgi:hypothetical protein
MMRRREIIRGFSPNDEQVRVMIKAADHAIPQKKRRVPIGSTPSNLVIVAVNREKDRCLARQ